MDTQELQQVALFDKCRQFTKAREFQAVGLYPYFNPISESEDTVVVIDGQKRIMLGSNNYLGLTHHPKVLEAASRLKVPPQHCIYFGDDERDIVAGKAAGMGTVAATYGYLGGTDVKQWGADIEIQTPLALLGLLRFKAAA